MVRIRVACWGRLHTPGLAEAAEHYEKRLAPWAKFETLELRSENERIQDSKKLAEKLSPRDRNIILSEDGAPWDTEAWAKALELARDRGQTLCVAIGAANGLDLETLKASDVAFTAVAFGKATLPHELAQVVLLEQLYRGLSWLAGHPYHRA